MPTDNLVDLSHLHELFDELPVSSTGQGIINAQFWLAFGETSDLTGPHLEC